MKMSVITLSTKLTPEQIKGNLVVLARACRCHSEELDVAFVKRADPRAIQGGAIDEEAHQWRQYGREIMAIARAMEG
jgi:hypothetical protein